MSTVLAVAIVAALVEPSCLRMAVAQTAPAPGQQDPAVPSTEPAPKPVDLPNEQTDDAPPPAMVVPPPAQPLPGSPTSQAVANAIGQQIQTAQGIADQVAKMQRDAHTKVRNLEGRLAQQQQAYDAEFGAQSKAAQDLREARDRLRDRAVSSYVSGPVAMPTKTENAHEYGRRMAIGNLLNIRDTQMVSDYRAARDRAGQRMTQVLQTIDATKSELAIARPASERADQSAAATAETLKGLRAQQATITASPPLALPSGGAQTAGMGAYSPAAGTSGFAFPVAEPFNFTDDWGAPRQNTGRHQGNDIFAPWGTPLFACERGMLTKVGLNKVGGLRLWIVGASGTKYYYAHLAGYAPGIADNVVVEAGQIVGYTGTTGDAMGTPPHLHFEIHPGGGGAVNPFPTLQASAVAEREWRRLHPPAQPPGMPRPNQSPVSVNNPKP